ncbi:ecto-NOX disulfide-thiol exchanger 1-like [Argiope bruennichi]|uniref:Ecto-NOX disulfide-thiol exchanger 1 like protein n=1 Tax=Argiope bruennichi TaxID=94029 RepID=A0A8T0F9W3_ARGBR|nr:ecto-NOX disulfide-thiol exchanger 1-like [Argiope bruennichi]KAF8786995.1 Ecto-NOX disulfide-thiol exchanger 1 like protein [Argiope bruennichi]
MEKRAREGSPTDESMENQIEANSHESDFSAEGHHVYDSVPRYSEQEAEALGKKLVNKETFREALHILITWLERRECNERNSAHFYFLIQLCWNHAEKLQTEQKEYLKEIERTDKNLWNKNCSIQLQLNEIEEVFKAVERQNLWDNFTQNQLEKMQEIISDSLNLKQNILKDYVGSAVEEKESNDMCTEVLHAENNAHKLQTKLGSLTYELNTVYQKMEEMKAKCKENENEILKLRSELEKKKRLQGKTNSIVDGDNQQKKPVADVACQSNTDEMHIVSLISVFLFDHPDGVNVDCIHSHLNKYIPITHAIDIENLLRKYPKIFKESVSIGDTQEKKWTCISFI